MVISFGVSYLGVAACSRHYLRPARHGKLIAVSWVEMPAGTGALSRFLLRPCGCLIAMGDRRAMFIERDTSTLPEPVRQRRRVVRASNAVQAAYLRDLGAQFGRRGSRPGGADRGRQVNARPAYS